MMQKDITKEEAKEIQFTRTEWAERISRFWKESFESAISAIFMVGENLIASKAQLEHGEWMAMCESDLPFTYRTATRLMAVARDARLRTHVSFLPPSWATLYELTRLTDGELTALAEDGILTPDMERSQVTTALNRAKIKKNREGYERRTESPTSLDQLIASGQHFGTILADPPWEFHTYSGKGKTRSAERHYDTMTLEEIKAMPVAQLAADDAVLGLWCVWPELPGALAVIEAWGFTFKTLGLLWVKATEKAEVIEVPSGKGLHWGMGYWSRANTEGLLLAVRGDPKRYDKGVHQVIVAPVGEHSAKPVEARTRLEKLVSGPYLELFAREQAEGWVSWGNEME